MSQRVLAESMVSTKDAHMVFSRRDYDGVVNYLLAELKKHEAATARSASPGIPDSTSSPELHQLLASPAYVGPAGL